MILGIVTMIIFTPPRPRRQPHHPCATWTHCRRRRGLHLLRLVRHRHARRPACGPGVAVAVVNTGQQVGGSAGTALLSTMVGSLASHSRTLSSSVGATAHAYTVGFTAGKVFTVGLLLALFCPRLATPSGRDSCPEYGPCWWAHLLKWQRCRKAVGGPTGAAQHCHRLWLELQRSQRTAPLAFRSEAGN
jgi:hypothetical protein